MKKSFTLINNERKRTKNINKKTNASKITNSTCTNKPLLHINTSENLPNEIRQIVYSFYQEKEATNKVYNNIANPIKL